MTTKKIKTSDILGDNYYIYELTSSNYTPALNGTITITCTMKDVYGAAASSKSITLYQNGTSKGAQTTNSSGVATWSITCSVAGLQKFNIKDTSIEVFVDNKSNVDHTHSGYAAASALNTLSDTVNGLGQTIDELADVAETGDYGDLINAPTNISTFNNDVGYLTSHQSLNSKTVTVEKLATAESGYLSSYAVKQNGVQVGNTINIPKDFLVKSGSVKTVSTANNPVSGYNVGDKYIDLVINVQEGTSTDSHIYILVSDLVDTPVTISDVTGLQTALNNKANNNHTHSQYLTTHQDITGKEDKSNKVTSISSSSTDTQYPSAKLVYDELQNTIETIVDMVYPVGSIYMSVNSVNPSTLFGGTWEQLKDKFLLASGDTYSNGATGGEATHTLTVNEMPSHTHTQNAHAHSTGYRDKYAINGNARSLLQYGASASEGNVATSSTTATNQNTGGGQAHNNMPPYLAVNVWKRTA